MREITIWKLTYQCDPEPGHVLGFLPSKADADYAFKGAQRIHKDNGERAHSHVITPITIKPTKAGILAFLDRHCPSTDNG